MKNILIILILLSICLLRADDMAQNINRFGIETLKQINEPAKNIFISPYSIHTALAMTSEGAETETATQMKNVLHLNNCENPSINLAELSKNLLHNSGNHVTWKVANSLWLDNDFEVISKFEKTLSRDYQAKMMRTDFIRNPLIALKNINQWVSDNTNNKIPAILDEVSPLTRVVLVNAVYFLADWEHPFKEAQTADDDFILASGEKVMTPFMKQTRAFSYFEDNMFQAVMLPYKNSRFSMLILLPKDNEIKFALDAFDESYLEQIMENNDYTRIDLQLPRFEIDYKRELKDDLALMGMPLAFTDLADFSGISKKQNLMIGQVMHRAYIKVDEKGTEAAAATAVAMNMTSAGPPKTPIPFRADHPFLFMIIDQSSATSLFTGILNNPQL